MKSKLLLLLVLLATATPAMAQDMEDADFILEDRGVQLENRANTPTLVLDERPRWGLGFKVGPFEPKFSIARDYYDSYFGNRGKEPYFALEGRFFFFRNTVVQLVAHLQLGYWQTYGKSQLCTLNGENVSCSTAGATATRGSTPTSLNIIPGELGVEVRLNVLKDRCHVPLVPYIRGSVMYTMWWVYAGGLSKNPDEERGKGIGGVWGLSGNVGIALNLDWIDRAAAREAMRSIGLKDTYIFFEYSGKTNKNFKDTGAMDFSGHYWTLGLSVDF